MTTTAQASRALAGKVAIITGAGQPVSIGRSHALAFAAAGAKVLVNDNGSAPQGTGSNAGLAQFVAEEIRRSGGEAAANADSVATIEGAERIVAAALDVFGRVDILVNNAGNQRMNRIFEATEEDFDALIGVHLKGTFNMVRQVAPYLMKQRSGVIINTASTAGLGMYGNSIYAAAKEGIVGFTRSIARDLGPYNIRCNAIRPGAVSRMRADPKAAEMAREAEEKYGFPGAWNQWLAKNMINSVKDAPAADLDPRHVANFVAWLSTDAAHNVNGHTFRVAGGEIGLMSDPEISRSIFQAQGWSINALSQPEVRSYLVGSLVNRFRGERP